MRHFIEVIIAEDSIIESIESDWIYGNKLTLSQGFSLIPMTTNFFDDINDLVNIRKVDSFDEFKFLSSSVEELLMHKSHNSRVAYIETDYWGGAGVQTGILFENQKMKMGPLKTEIVWIERDNSYQQIPQGKTAVNRILEQLGVSRIGEKDEFDSLGLGNFRSNEDIINSM
ncbi:hypothetical protein [Roseivirga sp.]|uniref:hypothetical protein n=1 Tax=Roseivirga sp. TaxID=1964215 RepID=UPI003B5186C6